MDLSVLIELIRMLPQRESFTTFLKFLDERKIGPGFVMIDAINSKLTVLFLKAAGLNSLFLKDYYSIYSNQSIYLAVSLPDILHKYSKIVKASSIWIVVAITSCTFGGLFTFSNRIK